MDTNGDGRISRGEWRGSDRAFRNHDWNGDGVLSGDEVRLGANRSRNIDEDDYDPQDTAFWNWTDEGFRSLDRNRDARISRNEWPHDPETFRRVDRNRDNVLSRAEFLGDDVTDPDREDRFDDLDVNNNGRIEWREWHGTRDAFEWLDRNNDGWLSRAETVGDAADQPGDRFTSLDIDRSGAIERDEWHWSPRSFNMRDRNNDGRLSRSELGEAATEGTSGRVATFRETVIVDAQSRWTDTGIDVRAGDRLELMAEGTVTLSLNDSGNDRANPSGAVSGRRASNAPLPTQPAGALIARIGDGAPFVVGARQSLERIAQSGRLYLGVNDDHLPDNRGQYRVTIAQQR